MSELLKSELLKIFLCHASEDAPLIRKLFVRLMRDGFDVWFDKGRLLPGQNWKTSISKAVRDSHVVIVCLSKKSVSKEGYIQKEIKLALDIAEEKPEDTIFLIPAKLEDCEVPNRLTQWQWVDLSSIETGYERLLPSLRIREADLGLPKIPPKQTGRTIHDAWDYYDEGVKSFRKNNFDEATVSFDAAIKILFNYIYNYEVMDAGLCTGRILRELCAITSSGLNSTSLYIDSTRKTRYLILFLARYLDTYYGRDLSKAIDLLEEKKENYSSSESFQIKQLLNAIANDYGDRK